MRVILDTNVVASGFFWRGVPGKILDSWAEDRFTALVTAEIFQEYERVIRDLGHRLPESQIIGWLAILAERLHWVQPAPGDFQICTDPDDNKFLAAALGGKADYIVSGDRALLRVKSFFETAILPPRQFLSLI